MSSEGLGEMFKGDSADTCGGKFPLVSMRVRAECPACADTALAEFGKLILLVLLVLVLGVPLLKTNEGDVVGF